MPDSACVCECVCVDQLAAVSEDNASLTKQVCTYGCGTPPVSVCACACVYVCECGMIVPSCVRVCTHLPLPEQLQEQQHVDEFNLEERTQLVSARLSLHFHA